MWHMILPIPYGFWFTVSHMVIFYLLHKKYPVKKNEETTEVLTTKDAEGGTEAQPASNPLHGAGGDGTTPEQGAPEDDGMLTPGR
eukprot:COSAG02_NODE_10397_length_1950_cov_1.407347_2_plen_84_part_01